MRAAAFVTTCYKILHFRKALGLAILYITKRSEDSMILVHKPTDPRPVVGLTPKHPVTVFSYSAFGGGKQSHRFRSRRGRWIRNRRLKMNIPFNIIYNRISDYFLARVHIKDYVADADCRQASQTSSLELDGSSEREMTISFLNSSLGSGDNLTI